MKIIYMGAEVPSNRTLIETTTAKNVGVSFWRLTKRGLPKKSSYLLENYFDEHFFIHVNAGIPKNTELTKEELESFSADYEEFVANNIDRLTSFTEINGERIPQDFVESQRKTAWSAVPPGKFQPVWSPQSGLRGLHGLVDKYLDISLPGEAVESDSQLASATRAHVIKDETRFHIFGSMKPDNLRQVMAESVSTLSWLSPMLHGETIIWDGNRIVRYPKKMKERARVRYHHIYEKAGLDAYKIEDDDPKEVCRLAIWSFEQFEARLNKMSHNEDDDLLADNSEWGKVEESGENLPANADNRPPDVRKIEARNPEEIMNLPVFGYTQKQVVDVDGVIRDVTMVDSTSSSLRQCNTCFIASNCPAFKPNNPCAFKLPIEVKTTEQLRSLLNAIIEMQGARVAFMRFAEEMNGGYADPNLSQEIDRLYNLVEKMQNLGSSKEFIRMTVERQGSSGVLSSIFGDRAQTLKELPDGGLNEVQTTEIIRQTLEDK
jgi:hypothetical protein